MLEDAVNLRLPEMSPSPDDRSIAEIHSNGHTTLVRCAHHAVDVEVVVVGGRGAAREQQLRLGHHAGREQVLPLQPHRQLTDQDQSSECLGIAALDQSRQAEH